MSKKYFILSGVLLFGIAVVMVVLKNKRTIREETSPTGNQEELQCKALTTSGKRCKRKALPEKEFCWQHQN